MIIDNKKELRNYLKARAIAEGLTLQKGTRDESVDENVTQWIHENEFAKETLNRFSDEEEFSIMMAQCQEIIESREEKVTLLETLLVEKQRVKELRRIIMIKSSIVAAAIIALSFILYNSLFRPEKEIIISVNYTIDETRSKYETTPSLVLENGEAIDLSSSSNIIEVNDESTVTKSGNIITYLDDNGNSISSKIKYNTLIVPKTCTYSILFTDSSEVVMNANSELRYPTKFEENSRQVYLKGEAYFKVKKGIKPFIVNCDNVSIKVYGTEFNVNFSDSTVVKTVLVSGSVGVKFKDDLQDVMIKPNEMLIANIHSNTKDVTQVNSARYTAWKDGYFRSDNESLISLLGDISKWYNVVFTYNQAELSTIKVSASLSRTLPIEEILKSIEILSNIKFIQKEGGVYSIE